ncbi:hypothetical protein EHYA_05378 [Embleya hyalina]|uniref:Uncharacterized protein n=1 Tax=Embleya hyalina TaxID=516124 RepID=A0A401YSY9_9ACTN|nr:hypothetical protein EHYA_05378 [Embleya hyalina]
MAFREPPEGEIVFGRVGEGVPPLAGRPSPGRVQARRVGAREGDKPLPYQCPVVMLDRLRRRPGGEIAPGRIVHPGTNLVDARPTLLPTAPTTTPRSAVAADTPRP